MIITDLIRMEESDFRDISSKPEYKELIQKKLRFLSDAYYRGCRHTGEYFLIEGESKSCTTEDIRRFAQLTNEDWFECRTKETVSLMRIEQLLQNLRDIKQNEAVILKGFRPADYCGQVWYTADHRVFIEAYKGGVPGIIEALEIPTSYVTDISGQVYSEHENFFSKYYEFDGAAGDWVLNTCNEEQVILSDRQRKEICDILRRINPGKLRMKITWILSQNELSVYDLYIPIGLGILE